MEGQALDIGWARDGRYETSLRKIIWLWQRTRPARLLPARFLWLLALWLAAVRKSRVEAVRAYGLDTGLAFQIQDDLLNLVGTKEAKEKDYRSDITEGKRTLVVVHALQNTTVAGTLGRDSFL